METTEKPKPAFVRPDPALGADWAWAYKERERGALEPHAGRHVAILNEQVIGAGADPLELRLRLAAERGIHSERLVVMYIEGPDDFFSR